ncbi:MAG: cardiolipin synthase [Planctomycetota bacterium]
MSWLFLLVHLTVAIIATGHLALRRKRPTVQLGWVFALFFLPLLGLFAYMAFGTDRLLLGRLVRRHAARVRDAGSFAIPEAFHASAAHMQHMDSCVRGLGRLNHFTPTLGNRIEALPDAETFYPVLEREIRAAKDHIWLQFYVWRSDDTGRAMIELLVDAIRRGVTVRLLVDEIGSGHTRKIVFEPFIEAGGNFSWTTTLFPRRNRWFINLRNHRKIVVVDGRIAFTGGLNIGDEYIKGMNGNRWHDLHVSAEGPVVRQLAAVFAEDWYFATEEHLSFASERPVQAADGCLVQVIAGGPERMPSANGLSIAGIVHAARHRLLLSTPFLAPDDSFLDALELAVARGVQVDLLVSAETDMGLMAIIGHSFFPRLIDAGVQVYEYPRDIHHDKIMLIDDDWVLVGSINLDERSFHLNYEVALLLRDPALYQRIDAIAKGHLGDARRWTAEAFARRPLSRRLIEGMLRMLSPVM